MTTDPGLGDLGSTRLLLTDLEAGSPCSGCRPGPARGEVGGEDGGGEYEMRPRVSPFYKDIDLLVGAPPS